MSILERKYKERCVQPSDINEHLPTLRNYANQCIHITETGVRSAVSSYAFATGLRGKPGNTLIQIDLNNHPNIQQFIKESKKEGVNVIFYEQSDLECPLEKTELLFIDTWHIYGQLKRELDKFSKITKKYIIMHDTEIDGIQGETIRNNWDAVKQSQETGFTIEEINSGLQKAIDEFLETNNDWRIKQVFKNNNGLTILERI
jgi:hypothetical protein